ncbi:MAG TPA: phosphomethylpyrimidine kinase, partial [Thermoproteales archaeon]|nr:phosphomethylpyrimidine kinase [Thermoproteales archaeon]
EKVLKYIPEVRTNIVMAKENASSINDVAAFPGRITIVKNKLAVFSEPEFGASKFLSKVLLEIMKKNPKIKALTCIKYLENMEKSLVKLGIKYTILSKPLRKDTIWILEEEFNGYEEVLIDKGGLGIEPVMYILGVNAIEVVKKAVKIISEYEKIPKYAL